MRPWLGPREVLAAFCDVLRSQERDDAFWTDLRGLLANLGRDLQVRADAKGWAGAQELFDRESYEQDIKDIEFLRFFFFLNGFHTIETKNIN